MLDGFESGDKNSLDKKPQLQEKVRRCITQGFIDPEDYNGVSFESLCYPFEHRSIADTMCRIQK